MCSYALVVAASSTRLGRSNFLVGEYPAIVYVLNVFSAQALIVQAQG